MNKPALKHLEEECLELAFAIMKKMRGDGDNKEIRKEMADVRALLDLLEAEIPVARLGSKLKKMTANYG